MNVGGHPKFQRAYNRRIASNRKLVRKFHERVDLFQNNPQNPLLNDHPLKGDKRGLRAFSISGDIRVIYRLIDDDHALFLDIGSHNQVYT